jgi:hypothetical protein
MFYGKMIALNGIGGRQVYVTTSNILFLEGVREEDKHMTNVHFTTGRWVSVSGSPIEVHALLSAKPDEERQRGEELELEAIRAREERRRKAKLAVEETIRESGLYSGQYEKADHKVESLADGTKIIQVTLVPKEA